MSPVRIPTIFATGKGNAPTADYYRQLAQKALRNNGVEPDIRPRHPQAQKQEVCENI